MPTAYASGMHTSGTIAEERGAFRPKEAAAWLGCSRDTIDRLCSIGELPTFKIGAARYIPAAALRRFVEDRERSALDS